MNCHLSRLLLAFRPHELAGDDRAALDAHLHGCPACAAAARRESAADAAVRTALFAVPVPNHLRAKLHSHVAARQGAAWRQKATRWGVGTLFACLCVVLAGVGGYYFTRPSADSTQIANALDRERWNKEQAVGEWLAGQGLPAELPDEFEFALHVFHGTGPIHLAVGEEQPRTLNLPCVVFHDGRDTCRVYLVRRGAVRTPAGGWTDVTGSVFNVKTEERGEWVFVIAYTSPTLQPFLKPAGRMV